MDLMVHEPIRSSFLLKYCNSHYCSENMRFIVEVDRFRDLFHVDKSCWVRKLWKQLDAENRLITPEVEEFDVEEDFISLVKQGTFYSAEQWPSRRLPLGTVTAAVQYIFENFLANDAPYWICIPSKCLVNTLKRLRLIHLYGRDVFCEALLDPIKTIQRDIQPRFLASEDYKRLNTLLSGLEPLPSAQSLKLPRPPHVVYSRYDLGALECGEVQFTLADVIDDRILYPEFMKFLEIRVSAENLYCIRAIQVYKETYSCDCAWSIFRYFVAPGSAYGISISHRKLKEVMRALASPQIDTFDAVEHSAMSALRVHFEAFRSSKEYQLLHRLVLARKDSGILAALTSSATNKIQVEIKEGSGSSARRLKESMSLPALIRTSCFPG
jgi:hypothetical protein